MKDYDIYRPHPSCMLILLKLWQQMIQMQRTSQVKKYMHFPHMAISVIPIHIFAAPLSPKSEMLYEYVKKEK